MSLTARHLEANGIPTVVVGSAHDIVEQCGVPRFVFTDFPLGNPCGKPNDIAMQHDVISMALHLLNTARYPRTSIHAPFRWDESGKWRETYMEIVKKD